MSNIAEQDSLEALITKLRRAESILTDERYPISANAVDEAADTLSQMRAALAEIADLPGEINPSNYDHDDACELNRQFCYAITIADAALTTPKIEKE